MTSMAAESATTILCTAKQTRFHIDSPNYREVFYSALQLGVASVIYCPSANPPSQLDVQGLHILVTSGEQASSTAKAKSKRSDGLEILSNAKLLLKEGQRYALVGRNGTGKSSTLPSLPPSFYRPVATDHSPFCAALLRAIADKLIPGIPEGTRIAILQQTKLTDDDGDENSRQARKAEASVLQEVIDQATARDTIEQEIKG